MAMVTEPRAERLFDLIPSIVQRHTVATLLIIERQH
jgi:hypothetical protein